MPQTIFRFQCQSLLHSGLSPASESGPPEPPPGGQPIRVCSGPSTPRKRGTGCRKMTGSQSLARSVVHTHGSQDQYRNVRPTSSPGSSSALSRARLQLEPKQEGRNVAFCPCAATASARAQSLLQTLRLCRGCYRPGWPPSCRRGTHNPSGPPCHPAERGDERMCVGAASTQ